MKLAYFQGCKIPFYLKEYDITFRAVMNLLGVELVSLDFHCCGYPERGSDFETSIYQSLKNLAIAEKEGLDIITPCKCCFGQFKHAVHWYFHDSILRKHLDSLLEKEGLKWKGNTRVSHLLNYLHDDYGLDRISSRVVKKLEGRKTVIQYGCHALRPFSITGFDHPNAPVIFEALLGLTGIEVIEWSKSCECCGNPVYEFDKALSRTITEDKLASALEIGADYICCACTHCQIQYEKIQAEFNTESPVTPVLFTRLLSQALGMQ